MRRITKAAVGGLAGCALVVGGTQIASGATGLLKEYLNDLSVTDLTTAKDPADPHDIAFDSAIASVRVMKAPDGTGFKLRVERIDPSVAGDTFGAHLHVGPCAVPTADEPDPTGVHYKHDKDMPAGPENEVWFSLVPSDGGTATDDTFVPFRPDDDDPDTPMSIVIHHHATDAAGKAGLKEVCLPVEGIFSAETSRT